MLAQHIGITINAVCWVSCGNDSNNYFLGIYKYNDILPPLQYITTDVCDLSQASSPCSIYPVQ